jgi:hypothetical protein
VLATAQDDLTGDQLREGSPIKCIVFTPDGIIRMEFRSSSNWFVVGVLSAHEPES